MQAAATLRGQGIEPLIVEKQEMLGGKLNRLHGLFPSFTPSEEVLDALRGDFETDGEVVEIVDNGVMLKDGRRIEAGAVIVATGFDIFPAERKEEYGYGVYDNVYTTPDIEYMLRHGEGIHTRDGSVPRRVAFLHCVTNQRIGDQFTYRARNSFFAL